MFSIEGGGAVELHFARSASGSELQLNPCLHVVDIDRLRKRKRRCTARTDCTIGQVLFSMHVLWLVCGPGLDTSADLRLLPFFASCAQAGSLSATHACLLARSRKHCSSARACCRLTRSLLEASAEEVGKWCCRIFFMRQTGRLYSQQKVLAQQHCGIARCTKS